MQHAFAAQNSGAAPVAAGGGKVEALCSQGIFKLKTFVKSHVALVVQGGAVKIRSAGLVVQAAFFQVAGEAQLAGPQLPGGQFAHLQFALGAEGAQPAQIPDLVCGLARFCGGGFAVAQVAVQVQPVHSQLVVQAEGLPASPAPDCR